MSSSSILFMLSIVIDAWHAFIMEVLKSEDTRYFMKVIKLSVNIVAELDDKRASKEYTRGSWS
jgi:hypothetical protein